MADKYVCRFPEVEALKFHPDNPGEALDFCGGWETFDHDEGAEAAAVLTYVNYRWQEVYEGDWIVKTPLGLRVFTPAEFQAQFEAKEL